MTVAAWGFGIDRLSFETEVCDVTRLAMRSRFGDLFPDRAVTIVDQGGGRPKEPRPCVTILISTPVSATRAGGNERYFGAFEVWTVQFTSSVDATYTVTVDGVTYTVVASGLSIGSLRDAMRTEMGLSAHPDWTDVSTDPGAITITSTVVGKLLLVVSSPASVVVVRVTTNFYNKSLQSVDMQVNLECWGVLDKINPLAVQSGPSIAELMLSTFSNSQLMQPLVKCGFGPIVSRLFDGPEIVNNQSNSSAVCQVVFRATMRMNTQVASGVSVTTVPVVS